MLYNGRQQVIKLSGISKENLTLAVLYIFLNIQSNRLRHTEIFHGLRDCYAQFRTKMKKVIDCMTWIDVHEWDTGKYLGRIEQARQTYNVIHGILHLCGINDKGPGEREIMEAAENKALAMR